MLSPCYSAFRATLSDLMSTTLESNAGAPAGVFIAETTRNVRESLSVFRFSSNRDFVLASYTFPEVVYDHMALLLKRNVYLHKDLWQQVILLLIDKIANLVACYKRLCSCGDTSIQTAADRYWVRAQAVSDMAATYFKAGVDQGDIIVEKYLELAMSAHDYMDVCNGVEAAANAMASSMAKRPDCGETVSANVFSTMVQVARAGFFCGVPAVVTCFRSATDTLPSAILKAQYVELDLIIDYYRFFAYCFTTLAITEVEDGISQSRCDDADVFMRVLLEIPSVAAVNNRSPDSLTLGIVPRPSAPLSQNEREELAFFYTINHLLRATTIDSVVHLPRHVLSEIKYFLAHFNRRISSDLERLASAASSAISLPTMESQAEEYQTYLRSKTLSAMLNHGTYKERTLLIANFFETLLSESAGFVPRLIHTYAIGRLGGNCATGAAEANAEVLHVADIIDANAAGKRLYILALDRCVRLLELLAIRRLAPDSCSLIALSATKQQTFRTDFLIEDICRVKPGTAGAAITSVQSRLNCQLRLVRRVSALEAHMKEDF